MRAAKAQLFDVIVAEDLDRLFRNQADYHTSRERLEFLGIQIHTASGKVGKLDGSVQALMGTPLRSSAGVDPPRSTARSSRRASSRSAVGRTRALHPALFGQCLAAPVARRGARAGPAQAG